MDHNDSLWVDRRLESLEPPSDWQPDSAVALERFHRLRRQDTLARRRRIWIGVAAAVAAGLAMVVWVPRVFAPGHGVPGPGAAPLASPAAFRETGSPDAPIVAEIYSDYECGNCAALYLDTIPQLVADFVRTGKLRLLHRDLPLPQHRYSRLAARYANAAGRLGDYALAVDRIFRTQRDWSADGDVDASLAAALPAAEMARVRDLVRHPGDLDASIDADIAMARADDVRMTPTLVVVSGGERRALAPVPPYPLLKSYLDDLIKANCRENPQAARC